MDQKDEVKKILIATAFPIHGAGSGVLVNLQSAYHKLFGKDVHVVTANNRDDFPKQEGIGYRVVPFKSENKNAKELPNSAPFNYLMFTTHTESTENFWDIGLKELEIYNKNFENIIEKEIEEYNPDVIHAQHNWLLSNLCTKYNKPVVTTVHGTDLIGYEKSKNYLKEINKELENYKNFEFFEEIKNVFSDRESVTSKKIEEAKENILSNKKITNTQKDTISKLFKLFENQFKYEYYMRETEASARNSEQIIVISDAQKEKFINLFPFAKDKVVLAENGFDERVYHYDEKNCDQTIIGKINNKVQKGIETGDINLGEEGFKNISKFGNIPTKSNYYGLFVGKFADFKGIDALLMAMKIYTEELSKQGKDIASIIVGAGNLNDNYLKLYDKLNLQNVHFVGRCTPTEIHELQQVSSFKYVLSRGEPFGLVVPEGTADGIPIIGANSGGIPSILKADMEVLPNEDKIRTPLGFLVKTLPDRPHNISDAEKDKLLELDMYSADYIFDKSKSKDAIINEVAEKFDITVKEAKEYLDSYETTVRLAAQCAIDIVTGKEKFDKQKLASYTSKTYGQNEKEQEILKIFDKAYSSFYKKISY